MIPLNTFTPEPELGSFLPPNDNEYYPLFQIVRGGAEIGNNSSGRNTQDWQVYYQQGTIHVKPNSGSVVFTLPVNNVLSVSLAFDTAMRVVLTWTTLTDAFLYYYDTLTSGYITVTYPGVTSSRVTVDKYDDFFTAESDVLFIYTKNNTLYYRQQRDRYEIEYTVGPAIGYVKKVGLTNLNRFQIDISEVPYSQSNQNILTGIYVPVNLTGGIAQIKKCTITPSSLSVYEGESVDFVLNTEWIPDGTVLEFNKLSGSAPSSSFYTPLTGTVEIYNNTANFTLIVSDVRATEQNENLIMSVNFVGDVKSLAKSPIVNILNLYVAPTGTNTYSPTGTNTYTPTNTPDPTSSYTPTNTPEPTPSLTPNPTNSPTPSGVQTYQVTPNVTTISEGQMVVYTITTTNVPDGTYLYWGSDYNLVPHNNTVTGSDFGYPNDLNADTTVIIINNSAAFTLTAVNDLTTEGTEILAITLRSSPGGPLLARANIVEVLDTSLTVPTSSPQRQYFLTSNTTEMYEGGPAITFQFNTVNVPNGTRFNYSTFNNSPGLGWFDIDWSSATSSGYTGDRQLANFAVYNNNATFTVWGKTDSETEMTESFKIQITPFGGSGQLALSETIYLTNVAPVQTDPIVYTLGYNTSWIDKTNWVSMVVSMDDNSLNQGKTFIIRIVPTNSVFDVSHLEWAAFQNTNYFDYSPMSATNNYIYQGFSSGPSVRLTAAGKAISGGQIGTFRTELVSIQTNNILKSTDYSVHY